MAEEIKKIITIETSGATQSLRDLSTESKKLDNSLDDIKVSMVADETVFSDSFNKMADGLDKVVPGTKKVYDGVNKVVGAVKALNTASKSNPWAAILSVAATAVAAIAANWDKVIEKIDKAKKKSKEFSDINISSSKYWEEDRQRLEHSIELAEIKGQTEVESAEQRKKQSWEAYTDLSKEYRLAQQRLKILEQTPGFKQKEIEAQKELIEEKKKEYEAALKTYKADSDNLETAKKRAEQKELNHLLEVANEEYLLEKLKEKEKGEKAVAEAEKEITKWEEDQVKIASIKTDSEDTLLSDKDRELAILQRKFDEEIRLLEEYGEDTVTVTDAYMKKRQEIIDKYSDTGKNIKKVDDSLALGILSVSTEVKNEYDKNAKIIELKKTALQEKLDIYNAEIDGANKYKDEIARINAELKDLDQQAVDNAKAKKNEMINAYSQLATGLGSIFGSIADIYEEDINARLEKGEIDEEQAKKEFESVKAFQISEVWLSTLAGMAGALASPFLSPADTALPTTVKIALGATTAASLLASGIAQTAKIANTQYGSSSTSGGATATVSSTATAYSPTQVATTTGRSDTEYLNDSINKIGDKVTSQRVYIVESDISDALTKAEVRESEATF